MRPLRANLLLVAASVTVGLVGLETWARFLRNQPALDRKHNERAQYTLFDTTLGWVKRPGARVTYKRPEYQVEVAINSWGLRDPERAPDAAARTRVLALGDSFVEGYSVPLASTVTQVLERRLRAGGQDVDVINGGTGGYSTDQEYLFYQGEGLKYDPRVVLLFFYYNDVLLNARRNYFGAPKPQLRADASTLVAVNLPLSPPRAKEQRSEAPPQEPPERSASALYDYVRDRLMRGAPRAYNHLAALGLWPALRGQKPAETLEAYALERSDAMRRGWAVVGGVLRALRDDCERRGAHVLVVYVPARFEIDDSVWDLQRIAYTLDERGYDRRVVARRLSKAADEAQVELLDLTEPLSRAEGFWTPTYYRLDGHWNERGHRVAAFEIERVVRARGWLMADRERAPAAQAGSSADHGFLGDGTGAPAGDHRARDKAR